jgi:acyl-CoA thioester hydrolase
VRQEKRIEIRWRDVDAYVHVNNAVYATYLEEVRDALLRGVLDTAGDPWDWVLARVAIDFRRELRLEDETAVAWCEVARVGTSSVTLREGVRAGAGWVAADRFRARCVRGRGRILVACDAAVLRRRIPDVTDHGGLR